MAGRMINSRFKRNEMQKMQTIQNCGAIGTRNQISMLLQFRHLYTHILNLMITLNRYKIAL